MDLTSSPLQIVSAAVVFLLGAFVAMSLGRRFNATYSRSLSLYAWHSVLFMVYAWYVQSYGGDATVYYQEAVNGGIEFDVGTAGVKFFTMLVVQLLGLSFMGAFLFYNIFGFIIEVIISLQFCANSFS